MNVRSPQTFAPPGQHIVIVGGGATGALAALHLLNRDDRCRVTVIEPAHPLGAGIAYSTPDPDHILNTRARNMSAYPDDPHHFLRWLKGRPETRGTSGESFVSRQVFGRYLHDLLAPFLSARPQRLRVVQASCLALTGNGERVVARLDDGQSVLADAAILATGPGRRPPDPQGLLLSAWDCPKPKTPDGRVIIIGSGLSMVDQVHSLLNRGHTGEILVVSRRGLLPRPHAPGTPLQINPADIPLGAPLSALLGLTRSLVREAERRGGTWRDAVDGLRPHVQRLWVDMGMVERARFLRHAVVWWDVHRHRLPPFSEARLGAAARRGQLTYLRGCFQSISPGDQAGEVRVRILLPLQNEISDLSAELVIDCRGTRTDPAQDPSPLVTDLLSRGMARPDTLAIGLDVSRDGALVDAGGVPSSRIFVAGPAARAAFWEITAIPDIREQAHVLAARLAGTMQVV